MEDETEKIICYCGFHKFRDLKKSQEVHLEIVQGILYHYPLFIEEETEDQRKNLHKATQSYKSHPSLHDTKAQAHRTSFQRNPHLLARQLGITLGKKNSEDVELQEGDLQ